MKIRTFLLFILSTIHLFAQSDMKAKSILDQVSEKTRAFESITALFEFSMENDEIGILESNKGTLILQNNQYKLSISGIDILCNGKTQWTHLTDANEVNISDPETGEDEVLNPASIFTIYEKGFKNSYLGEFVRDGKKTHKIELLPSTEKEFTRIILEIDQKNLQIVHASMFGKDGNTYNISVKSMDTTQRYPETLFTFDASKHPGIEIIDMR